MPIFSVSQSALSADPSAVNADPSTKNITDSVRARFADGLNEERDVSIPLYISGAIVQLAALVAVGYQMDSGTTFATFTIVMTLLGFTTSYFLRRFGVPPDGIKVGAVVLALLFLYGLRSIGFFGSGGVLQAQAAPQEMTLVSILALTATFCSFLLLTDNAVIFPCVWAIALIGLTGTVNINSELIVCFAIFFAAAIFLLVHQSHLSRQRAATVGEPVESANPVDPNNARWAVLRTQLIIAALCTITSLVLGFTIAIPLQMIGRNLSLNEVLRRLRVSSATAIHATSRPSLGFDSGQEFAVGLGPVGNDNRLILTVKAPKAFYWRGRVFSSYTGNEHSWQSSVNQSSEPLFATGAPDAHGMNSFRIPQGEHAAQRKKTKRLHFAFKMETGSLLPLYHAAEPVAVTAPTPQLMVRPNNIISVPRGVGGNEYTVDSDVSEATDDDLRRSGIAYPADIRREYLDVGEENTALRRLATEALQRTNRNNPFDRAEAIRKFVAGRCTYTLEARAVPPNRDPAEFFLNESQEGYCDMYATATTILCRYAGLPARLVTGFVPGTPSDTDPTTYLLTGDDRHAWTEVYYNGYGWRPLDATVETGTVTPLAAAAKTIKEKSWWQRVGTLPLVFGALGLLTLLYALGSELYSRFGLGLVRVRGADGVSQNIYAQQMGKVYRGAVQSVAKRSGIYRPNTMTPREYLRRIRTNYDATVGDALDTVTVALENALYGNRAPNAQDVQAMQRDVATLKKAISNAGRPAKQ